MIFSRPPINTVRKRFAWLPKRIVIFDSQYRPDPHMTLQPYVPGFYQSSSGIPPFARRGTTKPSGGGLVAAPVVWKTTNYPDGWIWLEWYTEELQAVYDGDSNNPKTRWVPISHRQQWNLWHEYD